MKYNYYINNNLFTSNKQGLKVGVRISKVPEIYKIELNKGEGPFESIKELKLKSKIYRNLVLYNQKRAQQVCKEENIDTIANFILTKKNTSFTIDFIEMIEHCTKGRIKNKNLTGIHFFNSKKIRVISEIIMDIETKVCKAEFEYYDSKNDTWIKKNKPSTFFPFNWTIHDLFHECFFAVENKKRKENTENVYISETKSGIKVEILTQKGKLKSIYPIIKEE